VQGGCGLHAGSLSFLFIVVVFVPDDCFQRFMVNANKTYEEIVEKNLDESVCANLVINLCIDVL
jgi:hypothetical protein